MNLKEQAALAVKIAENPEEWEFSNSYGNKDRLPVDQNHKFDFNYLKYSRREMKKRTAVPVRCVEVEDDQD